MRESRGEIKWCTCSSCGHKHRISEREIALYQGMVRALWQAFNWCRKNAVHEFKLKDLPGDLQRLLTYDRFRDWKMMGGIVYKPETKGVPYGINMGRADAFFRGEYKVPKRVWKNPQTGEIKAEDYVTVKEVPELYAMLNEDSDYIANYRDASGGVLEV